MFEKMQWNGKEWQAKIKLNLHIYNLCVNFKNDLISSSLGVQNDM